MFQRQPVPMQLGLQLAPVTRAFLFGTIGAYVLQLLFTGITPAFSLSLAGLQELRVWQLLTYNFLHGSPWHLLINMLMLAIFGREVETALGGRRFALLYLGAGVLAGVGWIVISATPWSSCLGASGAVFGVMAAFAALYPDRRITLLVFFVLPVTMTARVMALSMGAFTLFLLWQGDGNIAHAAHLVGGIAGYVYTRYLVGNRRGPRGGGGVASAWRPWEDARASGRRGRMRLGESDEEEAPTREEVDRILEKISAHGLGSLKRREREILDRASRGSRAGRRDEP